MRTSVTWIILLFSSLAVLVRCDDEEIPTVGPSPPVPSVYDWTSQSSSTTADLYDVFFINSSKGWVVGDNLTFLATSTGGFLWPQVPGTIPATDFRCIYFLDEQNGWITSDSGESSDILITSMGGAYPEKRKTTNGILHSIFFYDSQHGWAGDDGGTLLHTSNGGALWSELSLAPGAVINDLYFLADTLGWAATSNGIYRTRDGDVWTKEVLPSPVALSAIQFKDTLNGWACGPGNVILRREQQENGEVVWVQSSVANEVSIQSWNDLSFTDPLHGWIVGDNGKVYKSEDGGVSWTHETTGLLTTRLNAIHMVSRSKGWIAGNTGTILTYTP